MKLLLLLLVSASLFGSEKEELIQLTNSYQNYINAIKTSSSQEELKSLTDEFLLKNPSTNVYIFSEKHKIELPKLEFFMYGADDTHSLETKVSLAETDLLRLEIFLFLVPHFEKLYEKESPSKQDYAHFMICSDSYLMRLAKLSLRISEKEKPVIALKYGLLTYELSRLPFPSEFNFYRRRMMFSIDTKESALQEIERLKNNIQRWNSFK